MEDERGPPVVNGGMMKRSGPVKETFVTITADDIDKTLEQVKAAGGKLVKGRQAVADMGWSAYIKDSEGNVVGLWQSSGKTPM